jgi:hypothetical protein
VLILDHVATLLAEPVWSQRGLGRFPTFWNRPEKSENAPVLILDHVATLLAEPVWSQRGLAAMVRYQWVRASGDAPIMELDDKSREMWLRFDFERDMIQLQINHDPNADQWPIALVKSEPMN